MVYKSIGSGILKFFVLNIFEFDLKIIDFSIIINVVNLGFFKRYLLRVVVLVGSIVKLLFLFMIFGIKIVDIILKNIVLVILVFLLEIINVIEGIDMCVFDVVEYVEMGSVF